MVLLLVLLSGCVVKYGGPVEPSTTGPLAPPEDLGQVQARLDQLAESTDDVDRFDRLQAASDFAGRMRDADPAARSAAFDYLQHVLAIEERSRPLEAPALGEVVEGADTFAPFVVPVEEIAIDDAPPEPPVPPEEPEAPPEAPPEPDGAALSASASAAAESGDPRLAMEILESCRDHACWEAVAAQWAEARDAHVHAEREAAGRLFLAARQETDAAVRAATLREVRQRLADLADRYPDSRYIPAIRRNIDLVQRELEATITAP